MPYKDKEKRRKYSKAYGADWYQRNRKRVLEQTRKRKKVQRQQWHDFKAGLSCLFCGFSHPAAIDFHHPETQGEAKVSKYSRSAQWKRAYEEAAKCQPLCANCHRIYHYNEQQGKKTY